MPRTDDTETDDQGRPRHGVALNRLLAFPPVLDACCGSRMFWFDRHDERAIFVDKRREQHTLKDSSSCGGSRDLVIDPDFIEDFTSLSFQDETFWLVVFDPPHLKTLGNNAYMAKKYGRLLPDWETDIRAGFAECFRVLKPFGTLVFKWNETDIPLTKILELAERKPLFGHMSGKQQKTHWVCFLKS